MPLDGDVCYRALLAKDERFDGAFFVGVETTGIYCRPICPAKTPGRTRCRFFLRAIEAEQAGFRACFRCRPELAPGQAPVDAVSRLASEAVRSIEAGFLDEHGVDDLAEKLGVTGRHLRRALEREVGATPVELAQARRLALAKQLLHDSSLSVTEIAFVSGFSSLRRFHSAFLERFGSAPRLMKRSQVRGAGTSIAVRLDYIPPFDWASMLAFLKQRAVEGVERVTQVEYRRTFRTSEGAGWLSITLSPPRSLRLEVHAAPTRELSSVIAKVRRLFDLDARPHAIAERLGTHEWFAPLVAARPGLRVPGAFDEFELAVRAILGQQVSVRAATTLCGRLVTRFGSTSGLEIAGLEMLFPAAKVLARASQVDLCALGLTRQRAGTILALARAIASDQINLGPSSDPERIVKELEKLPGIGPWTSQYIAMRALRWPDAFPGGDLEVRKALGVTASSEASRLAEPLRPWRAYAVMHLWAGAGGPRLENEPVKPRKSTLARRR
ncbi:MAG: helix-turn-helix domain-containing protein [Polyangiaceae bacterium]|nr:helix-turn-helix domain-containing protein [Polyangiaceae bacterium]